MKKYILGLMIFSMNFLNAFAQPDTNDYTRQWQLIDSLIAEKNLPKTALKKVNELYALAVKTDNETQAIKALLYKISLSAQTDETDINNTIALIKKEIGNTSSPAHQSLLYLLVAHTYQNYADEHSWNIYNRSSTKKFAKNDIATWGADDFTTAVNEAFDKALANGAVLKKTLLKPFEAVILKGNSENLRPTLYDLVAHDALDHYKNANNYITGPAYAFEINKEVALGVVERFTNYGFASADTASNLLKALQLFQQLIRFHRSDAEPSAFIDVNLERIQWVYETGVMQNKELLYTRALDEVTTKYADHPVAAQAWYIKAQAHASKAKMYKPFADTANRYHFVLAKQLIEERLKAQPAVSPGNTNMQMLLQEITAKSLHAEVEDVNVPGLPFRLSLHYKNTDTLYTRIIKKAGNNSEENEMQNWEEGFWKKIANLKYIRSAVQPLPATNDYQQHSTEIKVDALPPGNYYILGSIGKNFIDSTDYLFLQEFTVSAISFLQNDDNYFVLHRETGQPLKNVSVKQIAWKRTGSGNDIKVVAANYTTDANGWFQLKRTKTNEYFNGHLEFATGDDYLESGSRSYYPIYNNVQKETGEDAFEKENAQVFLFTDRAIYRPAQTIYFKGIGITKTKESEKPKLLQLKDSVKLYLQDVNGRKVDSASFFLNEYSSFAGKFKLPQGGLTGMFSIVVKGITGMASISVEEYKRPKFYVEFDTLRSTYRLNDTVKITGYAKAYSGNNIDDAEAKFNIVRNTRFIYSWMFGRSIMPGSAAKEIQNGEIKTGADGKFEISFLAEPDESIDKKTNPVFDFTIEASVTDINGETREGNISVSVSYTSLQLKLQVPQEMEINKKDSITIFTSNFAGTKITADVLVKIFPLVGPEKNYRKRYWEQPDQHIYSREEYEIHFPYDEYADETNIAKWPRKDAVISETINTGNTNTIKLSAPVLQQGFYVVEATTKDKDGTQVKDVQYMQVNGEMSNAISTEQFAKNNNRPSNKQPGDTASLSFGSNDKSLFVITNIAKSAKKSVIVSRNDNTLNKYGFIHTNSDKPALNYILTNEDLGSSIILSYGFVQHNRSYIKTEKFYIPDHHHDLEISFDTYRNKTLPGSKENWTVKISGEKGPEKSAELLTAMYDGSLDQFRGHDWPTPSVWPFWDAYNNWGGSETFNTTSSTENNIGDWLPFEVNVYDKLLTGRNLQELLYEKIYASGGYWTEKVRQRVKEGDKDEESLKHMKMTAPQMVRDQELKKPGGFDFSADMNPGAGSTFTARPEKPVPPTTQPRRNFSETAFFFPQLYADSAGNYSFSFTMPEALTQWKWLALAHTKDIQFGVNTTQVITQKTLMVQPNMPRFLREADQLEFSAKINNTDTKELTGTVTLELLDAITNTPVDGLFNNAIPSQYFTVAAGQSALVKFPVQIPAQFADPITYRIVASTGNENNESSLSDGEENIVPILSNRMLVTESLPLLVKGDTTQSFVFSKLASNTSETLQTQSLSIEYTANPVWYAVQALPYLNEEKDPCAEQIFNRFYANAMATFIAGKYPRIKEVIQQWALDNKNKNGEAFYSNLKQNEELKQIILSETPWVMDAVNEAEQRKNIMLLFDLMNMSNNLQSSLNKLKEMQMDSGAFPWFKGGYEDRYVTQYITTGLGRLLHLHAIPASMLHDANVLTNKTLLFLDKKINEDYNNLLRYKTRLNQDNLSSLQIQYLYMRSYFDNIITYKRGYNYYYQQIMKYWGRQSNYFKAMIGLTLCKTNQQRFANEHIYPSLIENATLTKDRGMYWKSNVYGYYWYQAPIEQQAIMIEFADEVSKNSQYKQARRVAEMQTWLILQKQTNNWRTTKATADACYALLLRGKDLLTTSTQVVVQLGNKTVSSQTEETKAGSGYFKKRFEAKDIQNDMGNISVTTTGNSDQKNSSVSYGAVYWQYFENLDRITSAATPLSLTKNIFIEKNTAEGKKLLPLEANEELSVGDKVIIRIVLKSDRNMEYMHLRDMRAACMEPQNVLSGYKWQDGLSYYESTKDAATDFFISNINRGTYVFEYPVYITHSGSFSAGIATIQCYYAPQFSSHSEGFIIQVK